jgi:Zn-dependent M28 family amino/carboxypeptidase
MFGTAEPSLHRLEEGWQEFARFAGKTADEARIRTDVGRLPTPRNRLHWPEAMSECDKVLVEAFTRAGWTAHRHVFNVENVRGRLDYEDGRYPAGAKPVVYKKLVGANVVAIKRGANPSGCLVIGAHHDTIRDSPSADDNTASVAALLELARVLGPCSFRESVVLAAFDMEELGMFGSRELVRFLGEDYPIRGAVVYETMSYSSNQPNSQKVPGFFARLYPGQYRKIEQNGFRGDFAAVLYRNSSLELASAFGSAMVHESGPGSVILLRDVADLPLIGALARAVPLAGQFSRSDHVSFWRAGIPAILITDTANFRNPNYHLPTDTPDTLDYSRVAAIVAATAVTVAKLAGLEP